MTHDDRPEHIHSLVCGVAFVMLYALLRVGHLPELLAGGVVLALALPLMGWLAPVSFWLYSFARGDKRRDTIKTTDAGCGALVFLFFAWILLGAVQGVTQG